ncbi:hypothetical protein ANO14919_041240 [Xylariales sp. No.14919]|nr:hypothetical protein ANO14919_041240 [Xylariales sp. No.14919]
MDSIVGWQAGPTDRGTLTLVYSCLITIFACTWTVLHLNVPAVDDGPWTLAIRKAKWMAITVLFPEFIFSKAICDLRLALYDLREFDEQARGEYKKKLTWRDRDGPFEHICSWKVEYVPQAKFLYWILGLQPPLDPNSSIEDLANEEGNRILENTAEREHASEIEMSHLRSGVTEGEDNSLSRRSSSASSSSFQELVTEVPKPQNWTITHAHFANMGGVLYAQKHRWNHQLDSPLYHTLTGILLGSRYTWDDNHPLCGLILDKRDIEDKSKADSLLRSLTVLQALWVIVTAIARGANGLPVSQLEIATSAFSLSAAATYAACWWKPKDVSKPIQIHKLAKGTQKRSGSHMAQQFVLRLTDLSTAKRVSEWISDQKRVPNDMVWMEGQTPLIFTLMACSSVVFGGIHLIAWNFEFPLYPELILWRVSSLISSILPLITLGLNAYFHYRVTIDTKRLLFWLSENLKPLEMLPGPFWESLKSPAFMFWSFKDQKELFSSSPGQRDFSARPQTADNIPESTDSSSMRCKFCKYSPKDIAVWPFTSYIDQVDRMLRLFKETPRDSRLIQEIRFMFSNMLLIDPGVTLDFWDEYEASQKQIHFQPGDPTPNPTFLRYTFEIRKRFLEEYDKYENQGGRYSRISNFLFLGTTIIYIASRLIILVLLFTCLRSAPKGIYEVTPWTRFIPNIS